MSTNGFPQRISWAAFLPRFLALMLLAVLGASAETVTLPVAVSAVGRGGVPFVSDVRVFNTSYTDVLNVTAIFRGAGQQSVFQLAPREARAFDDICANLFAAQGALGAIEFISNGAEGGLVVTSQLRSPAGAGGHVGMFVPGLTASSAHPVGALTSLVNGESRTNIGVYNPNPVAVTAKIRLFDGPVLLGTIPVSLGPHAVNQFNDVYSIVGFGTLDRVDGYATVESDDGASVLFTYAAEADNVSGDLILIVGSGDIPAPTGFNPPTPASTPPAPTVTPAAPAATPTPTPTARAATVVNLVASDFQWAFDGGGSNFVMKVGQTYEIHLSDGDPAGRGDHGFGGVPALGLNARSLSPGRAPLIFTFAPTASQIGVHGFACNMPSCGSGHGNMVATLQIVQ
jgi:heme/copper-type cytochrome/quinol oxidase subunit 2